MSLTAIARQWKEANRPETITLLRGVNSWLAHSTDQKKAALFGTDTIPTAFTVTAPADMVLAEIRRLNPSANVQLQS